MASESISETVIVSPRDGAIVSTSQNEEGVELRTNGLSPCAAVVIYGVFPGGDQKAVMTHFRPSKLIMSGQSTSEYEENLLKLDELMVAFNPEEAFAVKAFILSAKAPPESGYRELIDGLYEKVASLFPYDIEISRREYGTEWVIPVDRECSITLKKQILESRYRDKALEKEEDVGSTPKYIKQPLILKNEEFELLEKKIRYSKLMLDAFSEYKQHPKFNGKQSFGFFHRHSIPSSEKNMRHFFRSLREATDIEACVNDFLENGPGANYPSSLKTKFRESLDSDRGQSHTSLTSR